jgi:NAD(P)-dependent dehydrogenase (short-subunit alcohol dehydrogenase family)
VLVTGINSGIGKAAAIALAPVGATPEAEADLRRLIPYQRVRDPEDIANAVAVLASDLLASVVGTTLYGMAA